VSVLRERRLPRGMVCCYCWICFVGWCYLYHFRIFYFLWECIFFIG